MGSMYSWATKEYLLDHMSIEQILLYYNHGRRFERDKAQTLICKLSYLLAGQKEPPEPKINDPDEFDEEALLRAHPELKEGRAVTR
jgi:hypothetical protein